MPTTSDDLEERGLWKDIPVVKLSTGGRPWPPREDLSLWPVLLGCTADFYFLEACEVLCRFYDRLPDVGTHPPAGKLRSESVDVVRRRTITQHLINPGEGLTQLVDRVFGGYREGEPLTWAEKEYFLKPYHLDKKNKGRIGRDQLLLFLERTPADLPLIEEYFAEVSEYPGRRADGEKFGGGPATADQEVELFGLIRAFLDCPIDDGKGLRKAWRRLHAFCGQY